MRGLLAGSYKQWSMESAWLVCLVDLVIANGKSPESVGTTKLPNRLKRRKTTSKSKNKSFLVWLVCSSLLSFS